MSIYSVAGVEEDKSTITLDGNIQITKLATVPGGEWFEQEYDEICKIVLPEGEEVKYTNQRLREELAEFFFYDSHCAGRIFCSSYSLMQNTLGTYGNEGILILHHRLDV